MSRCYGKGTSDGNCNVFNGGFWGDKFIDGTRNARSEQNKAK